MLTYEDEFITDSIDDDVIETIENEVRLEVDIMLSGIEALDEHIKNTLIKYKVYARLCAMQLEADGMSDKYKIYTENFKSLLQTIKTGSASNASDTITSITIGRG